MSRDLSPEALAALEQRTVSMEYLYEGVFTVGTLLLWSGVGPISWDSKTFQGNGWLQGPGAVSESAAIASSGTSIQLCGEIQDIIAIALREAKQSARGSLWLAMLNDAGNIIDTILLFSGGLDTVEIDEDGSNSEVVFNYESRLILLNVPREMRYTHEDQQIEHRGDKGFEHVSTLAGARFFWGRADPGRPK